MANVPETSNFDSGIYQIETTDPVEGGSLGISNKQAIGLANRTVYLRDQILNNIIPFIPVVRGFITGINPGAGTPGASVTFGGGISAASIFAVSGNGTTILITMPDIGTSNYKVNMSLESIGTITADRDCLSPVFKVISKTQFYISLADIGTSGQNIKIHMDIIKL